MAQRNPERTEGNEQTIHPDETIGPESAGTLPLPESRDQPTQVFTPEPSATMADDVTRAAHARPRTVPGLAGSQFGKYELIEEIGRGGMGVVYKARQRDLDRIVALKMILANQLASEEQVDRFYAEARAAAKLEHPNIVGIHEVGEIGGQHYFTMTYMAGSSLSARLQDGPLSPEEAAATVATIARAVDHLHRQGIVHRDLKPSNILLDESSQPCVTDFGVVKMLTAESHHTTTGAILGTPSYMAPEQAAGRVRDVGPLSDVYSLGAILYELLTGRPPFQEPSALDTLVQVLEGEPKEPSRLNGKVPRPLELICLKCLEKAPEARYHSAGELAADLDRFLDGEAVSAQPSGPWHRFVRWMRREPNLAVHLIGLALAAPIVGSDFLLHPGLDRSILVGGLAIQFFWALASIFCQWLIRHGYRQDRVQMLWSVADFLSLALLIQLRDGVGSAMVLLYGILIPASGLVNRISLVWFSTALAELSYAALVIDAQVRGKSFAPPHNPVMTMMIIGIVGYITAHQVQRMRVLSRYYEHRPEG